MAFRTTALDVRKIVKVRNLTQESDALYAAMKTANVLMTKIVVSNYDAVADEDILSEIEKYLAAHFFQVFKPSNEFEKAGDVSEKKSTKVDLGLNLTRHGQQAMLLDVSGTLKKINNSKYGIVKLSLEYLGSDLSTVPYIGNSGTQQEL